MGSSPCHAENRTTAKSFRSCYSEQKHFANALCPFSQSIAHKSSAKTELRPIRKSRERGREMVMGKGGKREREMGEGRVMYTIRVLLPQCFQKGGSSGETNSGMETVKIHIKTKE